MQQAGQDGGLGVWIANLGRSGVDGEDLDRCRQQLAAGVDDDASLGRDLLHLRELVRRHGGKPVVLDDVPEREAPTDRRGHHGKQHEEDECAGATVGPGKHARLLRPPARGARLVGWFWRWPGGGRRTRAARE